MARSDRADGANGGGRIEPPRAGGQVIRDPCGWAPPRSYPDLTREHGCALSEEALRGRRCHTTPTRGHNARTGRVEAELAPRRARDVSRAGAWDRATSDSRWGAAPGLSRVCGQVPGSRAFVGGVIYANALTRSCLWTRPWEACRTTCWARAWASNARRWCGVASLTSCFSPRRAPLTPPHARQSSTRGGAACACRGGGGPIRRGPMR